jgi:hypothetical protein
VDGVTLRDYREGGGREASRGQNGDDRRLHRWETRRTGNVVRQTEKRQSGTRIAAEWANAAGAKAAKSRATTIRSASSFREEFICLTYTRACIDCINVGTRR